MNKVIFLMLLLLPTVVLAQGLPAWAPPEWVVSILQWVQTIPKVGTYVVQLLSVLATVSVGMTVIATAVMALLKGLSKTLDMASLAEASDKIDTAYEKVVPYLKFLSMYNTKLPNNDQPKP